jgi:hypothetical protein
MDTEDSLFPTFTKCWPLRLRATPIPCVWFRILPLFWSLFLPLRISGAYAGLPVVLTIVRFDGTSTLSLHNIRRQSWRYNIKNDNVYNIDKRVLCWIKLARQRSLFQGTKETIYDRALQL